MLYNKEVQFSDYHTFLLESVFWEVEIGTCRMSCDDLLVLNAIDMLQLPKARVTLNRRSSADDLPRSADKPLRFSVEFPRSSVTHLLVNYTVPFVPSLRVE